MRRTQDSGGLVEGIPDFEHAPGERGETQGGNESRFVAEVRARLQDDN
jgi:hypothetical protein